MDDRILDALAAGPATAADLAARLGADEALVTRRLRMLFGLRVTRDGLYWRLAAPVSAAVTLAYLATSGDALTAALRAQAGL